MTLFSRSLDFVSPFTCSTASRYYLVGRSKLGTWSVCTLLRGETDLLAHETTSALSQRECGALLRQIHAGNSLGSHGGLQLVCKVRTAILSQLASTHVARPRPRTPAGARLRLLWRCDSTCLSMRTLIGSQ